MDLFESIVINSPRVVYPKPVEGKDYLNVRLQRVQPITFGCFTLIIAQTRD